MKIELKLFATSAANPSWRQILTANSTERMSVRVRPRKLTCSQLTTLRSELGTVSSHGPSAALRRLLAMGASGAMTVGAPYSYDDMLAGQTDSDLSHFNIDHDLAYIIPALQQALAINPGLEILANPWSPPGWMKGNDSLDNKNDSGTLLSSAYQPLANYFVKVLQAYAAQRVPIDAITPQNEPRTSGSGTAYPGLTLPEPNEAQFISQNLAPALSAAGLHTKDQIIDECSPEIRGFGHAGVPDLLAAQAGPASWRCGAWRWIPPAARSKPATTVAAAGDSSPSTSSPRR